MSPLSYVSVYLTFSVPFDRSTAWVPQLLLSRLPPDVVIFQPCLHSVSSPSALNTSLNDWYHTILTPTRNGRDAKALLSNGSAWVDVRDLADAHRLALEKSEAGGERIIISKGRFVWQDWSMFLSALHIYPIVFCAHWVCSQSTRRKRLTLKYSRHSQIQMCWKTMMMTWLPMPRKSTKLITIPAKRRRSLELIIGPKRTLRRTWLLSLVRGDGKLLNDGWKIQVHLGVGDQCRCG